MCQIRRVAFWPACGAQQLVRWPMAPLSQCVRASCRSNRHRQAARPHELRARKQHRAQVLPILLLGDEFPHVVAGGAMAARGDLETR